MSNIRPESRIKSLEKRATDIEAAIEEMSEDTAEELKAIRQKQQELFEHAQNGFKQSLAYIQENVETVLKDHTSRLDRIETAQTKQDAKLDEILMLLQQKPGP
jgi:uncharacterized coiled-coil protein SlyX